MNTRKITRHMGFYISEFVVLASGFVVLLLFNTTLVLELLVLVVILSLYIIIGLVHHRVDHNIKPKIVLEYVLISGIVIALFLLISAPRI